MFGFFSRSYAVDEVVGLGSSGSQREFAVSSKAFNGIVTSPVMIQWNVDKAAESNPDSQALTSITYGAYDGIVNGKIGQLAGLRGFRFNNNATRLSIKNRYTYLRPEDVEVITMFPNSRTRTGPFNLTTFLNLREVYAGNNSAGQSAGNGDLSGLTGFGRNLRLVGIVPLTPTAMPLFTTIENRFSPRLEGIHISVNGVGSIICDRLLDAVRLKKCYLGQHNGTVAFPPAGNMTVGGTAMTVSGHLDLSHCPLLEELAFFGQETTTNITLHESAALKAFKAASCTAIASSNAEALKEALDIVLASSVLERFIFYNANLTWTRDFSHDDIPSVLTYWASYGNIITGSITITSRASLTDAFLLGSDAASITTPENKNNHATVDISGLTNCQIIDLSNGQTSDLTLPVNTVCTALYLGGNKLDTTVNTSLVSQIQAMTSLVTLALSVRGVNANHSENGQDSDDGMGELDLSSLTALQNFYAYSSKLIDTLTLGTTIVNLVVSQNTGLTDVDGPTTALRVLYAINCTSLTFDFTNRYNIITLVVDGIQDTTIDLSSKSITNAYTIISVKNCPNLTEFNFPSTEANAILGTGATNVVDIAGNSNLSDLGNIDKIGYPVSPTTAKFLFLNDNDLDMDFQLGVKDTFIPTNINVSNNGMSSSNVNSNIDTLWTNRKKWDTFTGTKALNIGGTNGAASGSEVAPSGYKTASITNITKASTAAVTVASIGSLSNNDVIRIRNVVGMTQVNQKYYMIKNISGNTFELYDEAGANPINSTSFTTYSSSGFLFVEGTPANQKQKIFVLETVYSWGIINN